MSNSTSRLPAAVRGIGLAALVLASPAARAEMPWSVPDERQFSAEAAKYWNASGQAPWNSSNPEDWAREKRVREELDACLAPGVLDPCVGMVLKAWSLLTVERRNDIVPRVLDIAERAFEVDALTVAGDRRLPADEATTVFGLVRLEDIARTSATVLGEEDPRSVRRRVAVEVANWRAGKIPVESRQWLGWVVESKSNPEAAALLRNMEISHVADTGWAMPETLREAEDLQKTLGALAAPNLALVQLSSGMGAAAEASARQGYDAIVAARGADDPRTLAAALVLATVLFERDKGPQALPYVKRSYEALARDRYATSIQRIEAGALLAQLLPDEERPPIERATLALIEDLIGKPIWPALARSERMQVSSEAANNVAEFAIKRSEEMAQRKLQKERSRILTSQGYAQLTSNPSAAKALLQQAAKSDRATRAIAGLALLRLQSAREPFDLISSTEAGGLHDLLAVQMNHLQSPEHLEQILVSLIATYFYMRIDPSKAPEQASRAANGASRRLSQYRTLDDDALKEITSLRPAFVAQVQASWASANWKSGQ